MSIVHDPEGLNNLIEESERKRMEQLLIPVAGQILATLLAHELELSRENPTHVIEWDALEHKAWLHAKELMNKARQRPY